MSEIVVQGQSYPFTFQISGEALQNFTVNMKIMQHPGDTPAVNRNLTITSSTQGNYSAVVTPTETAGLSVGQWFIYITSTDADETIFSKRKINVAKTWV